MSTYIALLRGINVSGQKKILMADLKALFESQGFENVQTYIQSGNVVFECDKASTKEIARLIEAAIVKQYNYHVPTLVLTVKEIEISIERNPFIGQPHIDTKNLAITFLESIPYPENLEKLAKIDFPPDQFIVDDLKIYLNLPNGAGRTKLTNNLFENKLKVSATSRNWRTVNKLVEMTR